ncbi:hypothetical protein GUJ93_ZPchr0006g41660 [Zizania palustris]|uniref:Uncharacterized protein n=1 Tax=Zizania palustris TaxID=103762 RepID=A0A8J5T979_ZIZPA|nr:hypothetical protein GUJ93_ZPchr0006g41660 [Zizania palustris]
MVFGSKQKRYEVDERAVAAYSDELEVQEIHDVDDGDQGEEDGVPAADVTGMRHPLLARRGHMLNGILIPKILLSRSL